MPSATTRPLTSNSGNASFTRSFSYGGGSESAATIADWDGDGAKDILMTGYCENRDFIDHNYSDRRTFVGTQNPYTPLAPPAAPAALEVTANDGKVTIGWTPAPSAPRSTTYELYIKDKDGTLLGNPSPPDAAP